MSTDWAAVLRAAASAGLMPAGDEANPAVAADLVDLDYFNRRLDDLREAFPEDFFMHAVTIKCNPMRGVISEAAGRGFGAECATMSEVLFAIDMGFRPEDVVYYSVCKSREDLAAAFEANAMVLLDNEQEADVAAKLLSGPRCSGSRSVVGLRINPVVGPGAVAATSTATAKSKFGMPVTPAGAREAALGVYKKHSFLTAIHIHVGSQGQPIENLVNGAKICLDFVRDVEAATGRVLEVVDIGGGLSSSYKEDKEPEAFSYREYRRRLEAVAPELFTGKRKVITEFGRSLLMKAGVTLVRVEWVKRAWTPDANDRVVVHAGANHFAANHLLSSTEFRFSLADKAGNLKKGNKTTYDIAGPLPFSADFLAKDVTFGGEASPGDVLVVHDTGAYAVGLYCKFSSVPSPPVYAFKRSEDGAPVFALIRPRETDRQAVEFWG